jgi:hypothetical protein
LCVGDDDWARTGRAVDLDSGVFRSGLDMPLAMRTRKFDVHLREAVVGKTVTIG